MTIFAQNSKGILFIPITGVLNVAEFSLSENFDDGVENGDPWRFRGDWEEANGYLRLEMSVADVRANAYIDFEEGLVDATITYDAFMHASGQNFHGENGLSFIGAGGESYELRFYTIRSSYPPDYGSDPDNIDLPRFQLVGPAGQLANAYSTGENTSSFLDTWTTITLDFDSSTGTVMLDMESDGIVDINFQSQFLIGAELDSYKFGTYGWFTGHYTLIDNVDVSGETTLDSEVPQSTGFNMPIGDRDGLVVTEARTSEDGWHDGWFNANDIGGDHPTKNGEYHLGEDWNRDDGDDANEEVFSISEGRVVYAGDFPGSQGTEHGLGLTVVIEHLLPGGETIYSLYSHLAAIEIGLGEPVKTHDTRIGVVGDTGASGGNAHLHFELFRVDNVAGSYEEAPWLLAMQEFAYTTSPIDGDAAFHTEIYANGTVTWYDPSEFILSGQGFEGDDPVEVEGSNGGGIVSGGGGNDLLDGGNGGDVILGNDGNDVVAGGNGSDQVFGGSGSDYVQGGNGNDELYGGDDSDQIDGGNGADLIEGGSGNDILLGGKSADIFLFNFSEGPTGHDTILDIEAIDTIRVANGPASFGELGVEETLDGTIVHFDDDSSVLLSGFGAEFLTEGYFDFV